MTKFFKKSKTLFWGHFAQIWEKINFPGKKGLCQFLNIRIIYHRGKNQKKLMSHSCGKCRTDNGQTEGQTDRWTLVIL